MHRPPATPRPADPVRAAAHLRLAVITADAEAAYALHALRAAVAADWRLTLQRLAASATVRTEAHALNGARAALAARDLPLALATLQGWTENPRSN